MTTDELGAFGVLSAIESWMTARYLRIRDVFAVLDTDGSGCLSPSEFYLCAQKLRIIDKNKSMTK